MDFKFSEKQMGIAALLQYVPPRCRKHRHMTFSGIDVNNAMRTAREWRAKNGGKFISGRFLDCERWSSDYKGEVVWMMSVCYGGQAIEVTEFQLIDLNLELQAAV